MTAPDPLAIHRYGTTWPAGTPDHEIELQLFIDPSLAPNSLSKADHFRNAQELLLPGLFVWHPWALDMLDACCNYKEIGFAGNASSGKSFFLALWALLNVLADMKKTAVVITSTSIQGAKRRVWKSLSELYRALPSYYHSVLVMVDSPIPELYVRIGGKRLQGVGIVLIANDSKKGSSGKVRGFKADRLFVLADEMSDLSQAFYDVVTSNLKFASTKEHGFMQLVAAANPNKYSDPFSQLVKPKDGWDSISEDSGSWETVSKGICLHFDALKSPNYLARKNIYPLAKWEDIESEVTKHGIDSPKTWRDIRGFWCPDGSSNFIYTEQDIIRAGADKPYFDSKLDPRTPILFAGVDPAFSGGDRAIFYVMKTWLASDAYPNRPQVIELLKAYEMKYTVSTGKLKQEQLCGQIIDLCMENNVLPSHLGVDCTGNQVGDFLAMMWKTNEFLRVYFGGAASDKPMSDLDPRPACELCDRRVTELWFLGRELLRHKVLFGIDNELMKEMTAREYTTTRVSGNTKYKAETKDDMKRRIQVSPDLTDAAMVGIQTIRERVGLKLPQTKLKNDTRTKENWLNFVKKNNVFAPAAGGTAGLRLNRGSYRR